MPSTNVTARRITWSASRKKIAEIAAKMNTIAVGMPVSLRDGQVTLLVSWRTSCRNLNGLFAMISLARLPHPHIGTGRPTGRTTPEQIRLGDVRRGSPSNGPQAMVASSGGRPKGQLEGVLAAAARPAACSLGENQ